MADEDAKRPVLHVVVVGFHHQRGSEVEYSLPPLIQGEGNKSSKIPVEWKTLPFMAMPDGAHNHDSETTYFHLPSLIKTPNSCKQNTLFCVSCCRKIETKELKNKTEDITRHTVQKSVCVISKFPLYGYIQAKLEVATKVYFEERDFSQVAILEELYKNLNSSLSPEIMTDSLLHVGLSPLQLIIQFRQRVLMLFKLLLLEKKVIFYGYHVMNACSQVLSLVSLLPRVLVNGLGQAALTEQSNYCYQDHESDPLYPAHLNDNQLNTDQYGFPLAIFTKNSVFHPYLSLQQMDVLKDPKVDSFVVVVSNALYRQQRPICDVMVDLESGTIEVHQQDLQDVLALSTADLRFTDYIVQHVTGHDENETSETDEEEMENFNSGFISCWKKTHNYAIWNDKKHVGIDELRSGHPFQGQVGLNDLKIRLSYAYHDVAAKSMQTEQGRKLGQAVAQTGRAVGGAFSTARSFVTSWLSDIAKDQKQIQEQPSDSDQSAETRDVCETRDDVTRDLTSTEDKESPGSTVIHDKVSDGNQSEGSRDLKDTYDERTRDLSDTQGTESGDTRVAETGIKDHVD
ncbi:late secretory pathway protein AVL9 homolog isoform X2 [Actinia tenebrosa]|uniref:Late secretory pathway protein AVL9 homolog isoform X2 n=1 Tax=Actinia tenebrosa TaxID=6105 RepID=A0A6P8IBW4_ACTTE|nr:late secretory pathway protein AVL9 homolog isoform X2 [Actinia tenebrosa]